MTRTTRIRAHEKFLWCGWEFRLVQATSREVQWRMQHGRLSARLLYRDIEDPETPPEFTAILQVQGVTSGDGIAATPEEALTLATRDLKNKLVEGVTFWEEINRRSRGAVAMEAPVDSTKLSR